jgi:hypothetical protein
VPTHWIAEHHDKAQVQNVYGTSIPVLKPGVEAFEPFPVHQGSIYFRDSPDIRPDNPAYFDIRYPAGYRISLPDIRPEIR